MVNLVLERRVNNEVGLIKFSSSILFLFLFSLGNVVVVSREDKVVGRLGKYYFIIQFSL